MNSQFIWSQHRWRLFSTWHHIPKHSNLCFTRCFRVQPPFDSASNDNIKLVLHNDARTENSIGGAKSLQGHSGRRCRYTSLSPGARLGALLPKDYLAKENVSESLGIFDIDGEQHNVEDTNETFAKMCEKSERFGIAKREIVVVDIYKKNDQKQYIGSRYVIVSDKPRQQTFKFNNQEYSVSKMILGKYEYVQRELDEKWIYRFMRPTLEEFLILYRRPTKVPAIKVLYNAISTGDLQPGHQVFDAGTGSGVAALVFSKHVGPSGKIDTYEKDYFLSFKAKTLFSDWVKAANKAAKPVWTGNVIFHTDHLRYMDCEALPQKQCDMIFLDLVQPHSVLSKLEKCLAPGRSLVYYSPSLSRIPQLHKTITKDNIPLVMEEILEENDTKWTWTVKDNTVHLKVPVIADESMAFLIKFRKCGRAEQLRPHITDRNVYKENDRIVVRPRHQRRRWSTVQFLTTLHITSTLNTHLGLLQHDDIIGLPEGSILKTSSGEEVCTYKSTLAEDFEASHGKHLSYRHANLLVQLGEVLPGHKILQLVPTFEWSIKKLVNTEDVDTLFTSNKVTSTQQPASLTRNHSVMTDKETFQQLSGHADNLYDRVFILHSCKEEFIQNAVRSLKLGGRLCILLHSISDVQQTMQVLHVTTEIVDVTQDQTCKWLIKCVNTDNTDDFTVARPRSQDTHKTVFIIRAKKTIETLNIF